MSYLDKCANVSKGREMSKYSHYFKDVSTLSKIDIYRVIELWEIKNPCQQHALKKIMCAGNRGAKNFESDIKEAIASLERLLEMMKEDLDASDSEQLAAG